MHDSTAATTASGHGSAGTATASAMATKAHGKATTTSGTAAQPTSRLSAFFDLHGNGTTVGTEILAGVTTYFACAYILILAPLTLATTGMPWGAAFLATVIASVFGTLVVGLFANVPYAMAPGVGLNTFFVFTVVKAFGFTWQEALCMVLMCGLISVFLTATKLRKLIITCMPESLQNAIGGGIGLFVAYIGLVSAGIIHFSPDDSAAAGGHPGLAKLTSPTAILFLIGLLITIVLVTGNFGKGPWAGRIHNSAFAIAIVLTTIIGIPLGVTSMSHMQSLGETVAEFPTTFGAIFRPEGFSSLFSDSSRLPIVLVTLFVFVLTDIFDAVGTFIGTGRRAGIFTDEDMESSHARAMKAEAKAGKNPRRGGTSGVDGSAAGADASGGASVAVTSGDVAAGAASADAAADISSADAAVAASSAEAASGEPSHNAAFGLNTKLDRALFADCGATSLSGVVGTSNIVTVVESSAGIAAGGRTGLTSVVIAICFALSALFAPLVSAIPTAATAPVLVVVGCMMMSSFGKIRWDDISDAIPAFSASALMAFTYSITYGVAAGFITYCLVKTVKREARDVHPIIWAVAVVFIVDLAVVQNLL